VSFRHLAGHTTVLGRCDDLGVVAQIASEPDIRRRQLLRVRIADVRPTIQAQ
jgi:hypothetical protein